MVEYPGLSIVRPDSFDQLRIFADPVYVGREHTDGRWADHWRYDYHDPNASSCNGNFTMWSDINDQTPVMDFGPQDCEGGIASSHWHNFTLGEPDLGLWTVQDFSKCKKATPAEALEAVPMFGVGMRWASIGHHGGLGAASPFGP